MAARRVGGAEEAEAKQVCGSRPHPDGPLHSAPALGPLAGEGLVLGGHGSSGAGGGLGRSEGVRGGELEAREAFVGEAWGMRGAGG